MSDQNENPDLHNLLNQLNDELQRIPPSDEAQRQHLEELQNSVRALQSSDPLPAADHPHVQGLRAGLEHFEATHPVLRALIEQVLNTLSAAGI